MRQFATDAQRKAISNSESEISNLCAPLRICGESSLMNERGACRAGFSEDPSLRA
jgi:hypothetical protein